jgi:hypothetical protein
VRPPRRASASRTGRRLPRATPNRGSGGRGREAGPRESWRSCRRSSAQATARCGRCHRSQGPARIAPASDGDSLLPATTIGLGVNRLRRVIDQGGLRWKWPDRLELARPHARSRR